MQNVTCLIRYSLSKVGALLESKSQTQLPAEPACFISLRLDELPPASLSYSDKQFFMFHFPRLFFSYLIKKNREVFYLMKLDMKNNN